MKFLRNLLKLNNVRCLSGKVQVTVFQAREKVDPTVATGKTIAVNTLQQLLNIRRYTAFELVSNAEQLWKIPAPCMTTNFKVLQENGIDKAKIMQYPELLARPEVELAANLNLIKNNLPYELVDVIYLTVFETKSLRKFCNNRDEFLARIDLLLRKLETTVDVIAEGVVKRPFLLSISTKRLEEVIKLLKDNKVSSAEIIKDWWVLQYTPKIVSYRVDLAKKHNIDPIKTWMIRCTINILDRYVQRKSDNKLILGDNTLTEYLSARLQCSSEEARGLMVRLPAIQKKSMKKMQEIIDFLIAEGFQPFHICRVPKILLHSVQTTKKRIRELEKQGVRMDSLYVLTKSQKQYMQFYQSLVKSNAHKIKVNPN